MRSSTPPRRTCTNFDDLRSARREARGRKLAVGQEQNPRPEVGQVEREFLGRVCGVERRRGSAKGGHCEQKLHYLWAVRKHDRDRVASLDAESPQPARDVLDSTPEFDKGEACAIFGYHHCRPGGFASGPDCAQQLLWITQSRFASSFTRHWSARDGLLFDRAASPRWCELLDDNRRSITSRVASRIETVVVANQYRVRMTHGLVQRRNNMDVMSQLNKLLQHIVANILLNMELVVAVFKKEAAA